MASVEAPPAAGDGSVDLQLQALAAQEMPQSTMDAVMAGQAAPSAPGSAAEDGDHATDNSSPASSTKRRRGQREAAALAGDSLSMDAARPSRRAATAGQAATVQAHAHEQPRAGGDASSPRQAEQASALEEASRQGVGQDGQLQRSSPDPATKAQSEAEAFAAAAVAAALARSQASTAAAGANSGAPAENGVVGGKKRKRAADGTPAGAAALAAPGGGATPAAAPPLQPQGHAPSQEVDLAPVLDLARAAGTQEELRQKLQERYPPTRGRAAVNTMFRDLFLTLCPGQLFHGRSSALPHMSHRLFEMVGKPVGKPPAPYKPRGPRSPAGLVAAAAGTPGSGPPPPAVAPQAPAAPAATAARQPPQTAPRPVAATAAPAAAGEQGGPGGPAHTAAARAAATAAGDVAPLSGGPDPREAMAQLAAQYPAELIRIAALVRRTLGMQRGSVVHLRMMLKTLHLANQEVRFQSKAGKVLNYGKLSDTGGILCFCKNCHGKEVSASEFEEHSGSKDRRPADGIFLQSCNRSLKELLTLTNSPEMAACTGIVDLHMEACYHCNLGGELLCCDGCNCAFHTECVNLQEVPTGDWFCPLCVQQGITTKPEPLPLQPKQLGALKPPKTSVKTRPSSTSKLGKRADGHEGSQGSAPPTKRAPSAAAAAPGRVHMAAPTAPRAPRLGRPGARSNKNKRLFEGEEGALINGQKLYYKTTQGETLLEGVAVVERGGPSGILCGCCNTLISASGFEAHAGRGQRRAPYDNIFTEDGMTLKAMAQLLPDIEEEAPPPRKDGEYGLEDLADDAREVISELDTLAGGCVLCHEVDFQRGGFGPRTIMLCDQCEREFHVGCLKKCGKCELDAVPEGDWYCSEECERIRTLITQAVQGQQMEIPGHPNHTWQVMRGKDGKTATAWSLRAAQEILQESFDPIMDLASNTDLLPVMLYARRAGEWDYSNCLTLLLRHRGKPVVAAIVRVFGPQMAELPLIATKNNARRQGHARILVDCFQDLLKKAGVHTLVLPAAHETVETWKNGFGFADMPEDDCRLAKQQLRILIFPGTEVLWKHFKEVPPPQGHHILVPPPDKPSAEDAADALEVAAITANMVSCVAAAFGEPVLPEELGMTAHEVAEAQQGGGGGAPLPAAQQLPMAVPQPAAAGRPPPTLAQQAAAPPQQQQQQLALQQQQQQPAAPPPDEYEAMLAAAMRAVDREGRGPQAGPGWAAGPPPWGAAAVHAEGTVQPAPAASDSDVSISDADEDDDALTGDATAPASKRARQQ